MCSAGLAQSCSGASAKPPSRSTHNRALVEVLASDAAVGDAPEEADRLEGQQSNHLAVEHARDPPVDGHHGHEQDEGRNHVAERELAPQLGRVRLDGLGIGLELRALADAAGQLAADLPDCRHEERHAHALGEVQLRCPRQRVRLGPSRSRWPAGALGRLTLLGLGLQGAGHLLVLVRSVQEEPRHIWGVEIGTNAAAEQQVGGSGEARRAAGRPFALALQARSRARSTNEPAPHTRKAAPKTATPRRWLRTPGAPSLRLRAATCAAGCAAGERPAEPAGGTWCGECAAARPRSPGRHLGTAHALCTQGRGLRGFECPAGRSPTPSGPRVRARARKH